MSVSDAGHPTTRVGTGSDPANAGLLVGAQPTAAIDPVAAQLLPAHQGSINDNPGAIRGPALPVAGSQYNVGGTS